MNFPSYMYNYSAAETPNPALDTSLMNGYLDSSLTNFTRVGLPTMQSSSSDESVSNSPDSVIQIDVSQINPSTRAKLFTVYI